MRISEDRYDRDRQRLELALRFLTHEARTQTIRVWTGLSDDRIRKMQRCHPNDPMYLTAGCGCMATAVRGPSAAQENCSQPSRRIAEAADIQRSLTEAYWRWSA